MEYLVWSIEIVVLAHDRPYTGFVAGLATAIAFIGSIVYTYLNKGLIWTLVPILVAPMLAGLLLGFIVKSTRK